MRWVWQHFMEERKTVAREGGGEGKEGGKEGDYYTRKEHQRREEKGEKNEKTNRSGSLLRLFSPLIEFFFLSTHEKKVFVGDTRFLFFLVE